MRRDRSMAAAAVIVLMLGGGVAAADGGSATQAVTITVESAPRTLTADDPVGFTVTVGATEPYWDAQSDLVLSNPLGQDEARIVIDDVTGSGALGPFSLDVYEISADLPDGLTVASLEDDNLPGGWSSGGSVPTAVQPLILAIAAGTDATATITWRLSNGMAGTEEEFPTSWTVRTHNGTSWVDTSDEVTVPATITLGVRFVITDEPAP